MESYHADRAESTTSLWPPDSDLAFWEARTAYDDACAAAAGFLDRYEDEAPEAELPDYEPEAPDREWWAEQLEHLESQRPACEGMAETLAYLDAEIAATRRGLFLAEVDEFLAQEFEQQELRGGGVGHDLD